jgi:hypothetical protein
VVVVSNQERRERKYHPPNSVDVAVKFWLPGESVA